MLHCILQGGYTGTVYPVNPNVSSVMSVKTYPSILDVPDEVDLAVIAVPAKSVAKVADECGQKGVHTLIVISDGFREAGPEGAAREKELRNIASGTRHAGRRAELYGNPEYRLTDKSEIQPFPRSFPRRVMLPFCLRAEQWD